MNWLRSILPAFGIQQQRHNLSLYEQFARDFPGRCLICSFHRFGFFNGMTKEPAPKTHFCIEKNHTL